jgi:ubiquinone/menaquinone biosynthesis C-methylase UbiE
MTCIDLGCGIGTFSFPLLLCVSDEGKIYIVDDSDEIMDRIRAQNPPPNLVLVYGDVRRTGLEDSIADFCLLSSILHEVDPPDTLLAEAFRSLKHGGSILDLNWKAELDSPAPHRKDVYHEKRLRIFFEKWALLIYNTLTGPETTMLF